MLWNVCTTPLGFPVLPDVYTIRDMSSGLRGGVSERGLLSLMMVSQAVPVAPLAHSG